MYNFFTTFTIVFYLQVYKSLGQILEFLGTCHTSSAKVLFLRMNCEKSE